MEDSEDVLALAREHLAALGYHVLAARNADEALAALDSHDGVIDLLFTDLIMPGSMNGLALAERVKERLPDIPVLLTTGHNEELVAHGPQASSMDLIGKPYRRSELADRVRVALNRPESAARTPPRGHRGPRHEG